MKNKHFIILILIIISFLSVKAKSDFNNSNDLFTNWTDEQFQRHDDSIIAALYAPVIEHSYDSLIANVSNNSAPRTNVSRRNSHIPTIINIDKTKSVGQITINSDISSNGAKIYNVPIKVYPGMRDFNPQISLSYNSLGGNSIIGVGWSISGLPTITRAGKCMYFDDNTQGILMDNSDSFFLDGVRMIRIDTNSNYILYETEYGNIKVVGHVSGGVMTYFEVYYPNGNKGVFGNASNANNLLQYPIYSLSNIVGNTIYYTYTLSNNIYHINKISYNDASIEFRYTYRPDSLQTYAGGLKLIEPYLLKSITTKLGNSTLGQYSLTYITQNSNSLLSQIDYSAGDESLNPLKFYYGEGISDTSFSKSTTRLSQWYTSDDPNMIKVSMGKFDYDCGADGLIVLPNKNPYFKYYRNPTAFRHSQNRFDNLFTGDEKIFLYTGLKDNWSDPIPDFYTGKGFIDILCADLQGQQEELVIKINNNVVDDNDQVTFEIYQSNLHTGLSKLYTRTFSFPTVYTDADGGKSIQPKFYYVGDFNGDGKMDIMATSVHQPFDDVSKPSMCYIFDLIGNRILYEGHIFAYNIEFYGTRQSNPYEVARYSDYLFVMDYDGDGKADICHIDENEVSIYTFEINNGTLSPHKVSTFSDLSRSHLTYTDLVFGDFNGDGLVDFLKSPIKRGRPNSNTWTIYNSLGNGQFKALPFGETSMLSNNHSGSLSQDINGDGLTDVITYKEDGFNLYLTHSNRFSTSLHEAYNDSNSIIVPVRLNSHNSFTKLLCLKDDIVTKYSFSRDDQKENMMTAMVNSFGIIEHNEYNYINDEGVINSLYIRGYDAVFPHVNIQEPIPVLTSSTSLMNGNEIDHLSITYNNAVINRHGRGFCGFEKISYTNHKGQISTRIFDPYHFGILKEETTPTHQTLNTYSINLSKNKLAKILPIRTLEKDLLNKTSRSNYIIYDNKGYPTSEIINYSSNINEYRTYTYFNNDIVGDGYYLGFPKKTQVNKSRQESNYNTATEIELFKPGLPKKITKSINNTPYEEQVFEYDAVGNVTSETTSIYGSPNSKTTTYSYDKSGKLIKKTDFMGSATSYTYNSLGQTSSITDYRGNTINISYDGFDRVIKTFYPDDTNATTVHSWSNEVSDGLYAITQMDRDESCETIYFDALTREVRSSKKLFDGTTTNIDKIYDTYGNLSKKSLPYIGKSANSWITYTYDTYDRLLSVNELSGRKTLFTYAANSVTSVKDNISKTTEYDILGNVISVTDPGGTITYNLEADGQPSSIVAPGGNTTHFTYDTFRRRISLEDPSHGLITYDYDNDGNLKTQTNANGESLHFQYDSFGRINKKIQPEATFSYTYNVYNEPIEIKSSEGTSKSWTYDSLGRITTFYEKGLHSIWLKKHYTYSKCNIKSITHETKNGVLVKEEYHYKNGYLNALVANYNLIFEVTKVNSFGLPAEIDANGLERKYEYSSNGFPVRRSATTPTGRKIQSIFNKFNDPSNTLYSRTDEVRNIEEFFKYDQLNRLISSGKTIISYDENGNIIKKSDVGTFGYNIADRPYAISDVELSGVAIPSFTQEIEYTSFGLPKTIKEHNNQSSFIYDEENQRVWMGRSLDSIFYFNYYYLGDTYENYQTPSSTTERIYLGGDYYSAPAVYIRTNQGKENIYHLMRDHLGSITHIVSGLGDIVQELSYDAWGKLRDPVTYTNYAPGEEPDLFIGRGFTGHEHLKEYGLINMNARLYDPALGRFLSPDPYVQMPDFSQNFNRYTYTLNNPLCYVDKDGKFFWAVVGVAAGVSAIINVATHWKEIKAAGGWNGFMKGAGYFMAGAAAGGISAAVGIGAAVGFGSMLTATAASFTAGTTGFYAGASIGALGGATSGLITNTANALIEGESFGSSLDKGLYGAITGGVTGGIFGGITGGIQALQTGKNFFNGQNPKIQNRAANINNTLISPQNQNTYSGYYGVDRKTGEIRYVGITKRPLEIRFNEHLSSGSIRADLEYIPAGINNLSKIEARIWEQNKINNYGFLKNGGTLFNLRNEISPKYWPQFHITF